MKLERPALAVLLCAVVGSGCLQPTVFVAELDREQHGFDFESYEIVIDRAKRQTVLTGSLLGGAVADLAVVGPEEPGEDRDRRLRIYAFDDGTFVPKLDAALRPEVLFVDVANIDGRDRLVTYEPGRLSWFDPETARETELVSVRSDFAPPLSAGPPHVDITRDVNGDDRDDLVVPDIDGFWVFVQTPGGTFADPVKLAPSAAGVGKTLAGRGYRYAPWEQGRVHEMDYDHDGRSDLVFWNEDHFEVHRQDERGLFAPTATTFTTDVAFDSDDRASLAAPQGVRNRRRDHMPPGRMTGRVLHSLTDMNGDGVADLVIFSLEVKSMWSARSSYEVHYGSPTEQGGTAFAADVGTEIRSNGLPVGAGPRDIDHDGEVDMLYTTIGIGPFKTIGMIVGTLVTRSLSLKLTFYRMEDGAYPSSPSTTRKAKALPLKESGERSAIFPSVLIGDVNGDKRSDLLVQKGRKELRVFLGVPGTDLFAKRPQRVVLDMPNEEHTWLVDLDRDGMQDVLMHHTSSAGEPQRVTLLIAR
jgi:hypothetical protein